MFDITLLHTTMLERGLTTFGLSKKAKMPEATVRQIFQRGSGHPANILKIARTLRVPMKRVIMLKKSA